MPTIWSAQFWAYPLRVILTLSFTWFVGNHKTLALLSPWGRWADRGRRRNLSKRSDLNSPWYRRLDSNQHLSVAILETPCSRHRWNVHPLSYYGIMAGVVGFEPTHTRFKVWRLKPLDYTPTIQWRSKRFTMNSLPLYVTSVWLLSPFGMTTNQPLSMYRWYGMYLFSGAW